MNYLALLGWSYDDRTELMSRVELVERFTLERVGTSPAVFDYQKLEWMNGVYLRALPEAEYADALVAYLREEGCEWNEERIRAAVPLVQEKIPTLGGFAEFAGFLFGPVSPDPAELAGADRVLEAAAQTLSEVEPFAATAIEEALRGLAARLDLKPRQAFQPIRVALTGSRVSPGLFESIELLGRDETVARLSAADLAAA
jgi:glutamyl-tRNA synthetase